tara:strand:- start:9999 stop:10586 length:588 start_codon:yes stop_codon:yes gene_type:complete
MLQELLELDTELLLFLNGKGDPTWDYVWLYLSRTLSFITVPIFCLSLLLVYRLFDVKKMALVVIIGVVLLMTTEYLSIFIKELVQRPRPCYNPEINHILRIIPKYCGGKYGYFSAHAINSAAFATYFALLFRTYSKYVSGILLIWALLVSYSRMALGVHYPLDVLTGITLGMVLASFAFSLFNTIVHHRIERPKG